MLKPGPMVMSENKCTEGLSILPNHHLQPFMDFKHLHVGGFANCTIPVVWGVVIFHYF